MTSIIKQPNGKWRVRDAYLEVDEQYETHKEAQQVADKCNIEKIKSLAKNK